MQIVEHLLIVSFQDSLVYVRFYSFYVPRVYCHDSFMIFIPHAIDLQSL